MTKLIKAFDPVGEHLAGLAEIVWDGRALPSAVARFYMNSLIGFSEVFPLADERLFPRWLQEVSNTYDPALHHDANGYFDHTHIIKGQRKPAEAAYFGAVNSAHPPGTWD